MKKAVIMLVFLSLFLSAFAGSSFAASAGSASPGSVSGGSPSVENKSPKLFLNGQELKSVTAPRIENSTTYIPIRTVAEGMGFDVSWDSAAKKVGIHNARARWS